MEGRIIRNSQIKERKAMEGASKIATEAIMNIRTVHSISMKPEHIILRIFSQLTINFIITNQIYLRC